MRAVCLSVRRERPQGQVYALNRPDPGMHTGCVYEAKAAVKPEILSLG